MKTPAYKKRRMLLKKLRSAVRHRKEGVEGVTYETNCALLTEPAIPANEENDSGTEEDLYEIPIILLDLETSGFQADCDILQIAAKCNKTVFSTYVNPVQQISPKATEAHGLVNRYGDLMHNGVKVPSVPIRIALGEFCTWLQSFGKKSCIATHNLTFDGPRLYRAITKNNLVSDFSMWIHGFIDTLPVIRTITGRKGKSSCTLSGLADALNIQKIGAHNAINDCAILHKILKKLEISNTTLLESATLFSEQINHWQLTNKTKENFQTLLPMQNLVSSSIRQKLALADITLDILKNKYETAGAGALEELIEERIKSKGLHVQKASMQKIINWFH